MEAAERGRERERETNSRVLVFATRWDCVRTKEEIPRRDGIFDDGKAQLPPSCFRCRMVHVSPVILVGSKAGGGCGLR